MRGFTQKLTRKEKAGILAEWAAISMAVAWLFYDSFWALPFLLLLSPGWVRFRREAYGERRRRRYAGEFEEGIRALAAAVAAGYSVEHAVGEAWRNLRMMHAKDNAMMEELHDMVVGMSMNQSAEQLFHALADRSGLEDAASFAEVFSAAKRTGGNLVEIMGHTARMMEEKEAVNREIEVLLAGKKYEQRIMSLIPFGIVVYMRIGSPGYMDALYHSVPGVCTMTLALAVYGAAVYMGSRVLRIEI